MMIWVEEWGDERSISSSSKSPVEVFARITLEKRLKTKKKDVKIGLCLRNVVAIKRKCL